MRILHTNGRDAKRARAVITQLEGRRVAIDERAAPVARRIVDAVGKGGDAALRRYATRFDGVSQQIQLRISDEEMKQAWNEVSADFRSACSARRARPPRYARKRPVHRPSAE